MSYERIKYFFERMFQAFPVLVSYVMVAMNVDFSQYEFKANPNYVMRQGRLEPQKKINKNIKNS